MLEYSFNECNYVNWLIWCNWGLCISLSLLWSKGFPSTTRSRLHLWSGFCLPTREELVSFTEKPSILCFPPKKGWISSSHLSSGFAMHLDKYCISIWALFFPVVLWSYKNRPPVENHWSSTAFIHLQYRIFLHIILFDTVPEDQKVLNLLLMFLKEIDDYIVQAKERSYETMVNFGKQGLSIAATAAVSAAVKASVCVGDSQTEWERAFLNTIYMCFWYAG